MKGRSIVRHTSVVAACLIAASCDLAEPGSEYAEIHESEDAPELRAPEGGADGPGQLRVLLTDAPADVDAVFVTFDGVAVQDCGTDGEDDGEAEGEDDGESDDEQPEAEGEGGSSEGGDDGEADEDEATCENGSWREIEIEATTLDLLTLQGGVTAELGVAMLPSGTYGKIRLDVVDVTIMIDGEELPVTVPPGFLDIAGGFSLAEGMTTEVLIDFDVDHSLVYSHGQGWKLNPVLHLVSATAAPTDP